MIWQEVEEKYGKEIADKMKTSHWLDCITITMRDGEPDIPEEDLDRAYRSIQGLPIHPLEWD
jgi:hypothetical protein